MLLTGTVSSMLDLIPDRSVGRFALVRDVLVAIMPHPMSVPTAAGMTVSWLGDAGADGRAGT